MPLKTILYYLEWDANGKIRAYFVFIIVFFFNKKIYFLGKNNF